MTWIFFLYLSVLLLIGLATRRATRGMGGFLLGDRRMGPWTTALSYEATAACMASAMSAMASAWSGRGDGRPPTTIYESPMVLIFSRL